MDFIVRPGFRACQRTAVAAASAVLLACPLILHGQEQAETVAEAAEKIAAQLGEIEKAVGSNEAAALSPPIEALARNVDTVREKTIMIFGERRRHWEAADAKLRAALSDLAAAVQQTDHERSQKALETFRTTWATMKSKYPAEALEKMPPLWTCPMHPEVMQRDAEACPTCGMGLDPLYVTQPRLSRDPIIRAEIVADEPLSVGKKADLRIRLLFNKDGSPVSLDDLEVTHTKRIHLLIIDLTQTDYHHEHPEPVGNGEYAFSITPKRPGPYRVWADLKPALTRVQQYAIADIPGETAWVEPPGNEAETREAVVNGYTFKLSFEKPEIRAGDTVLGKLHVTGPDGKSFDKLEVVMGAFGHFVGFQDYSTVLHIHPIGPEIEESDAVGGPELHFYFRSPEPVLTRFFTQVQINGENLFPRFIVKVHPRPKLFAPSQADGSGLNSSEIAEAK